MQPLGIGTGELIVILFIVVFSIGLPIISLIDLARKKLSPTPLAIWALMICIVPVLGSLAYWIVKPNAENKV
jgi:hypothetical protein